MFRVSTASPRVAAAAARRHPVVIVEGLSATALVFRDPCASPGVVQRPVDNPVLEQFVEKILETVEEAVAASASR